HRVSRARRHAARKPRDGAALGTHPAEPRTPGRRPRGLPGAAARPPDRAPRAQERRRGPRLPGTPSRGAADRRPDGYRRLPRHPPDSRIRVLQVGSAMTPAMRRRARDEMQRNPRYRWLGDRPHRETRTILARCRLMVLSSRMEGGANVISEALASGVPVLASRIPG